MRPALALIGKDLARALQGLANHAAIDQAVAQRSNDIAEKLERHLAANGVVDAAAHTSSSAQSGCVIEVSVPPHAAGKPSLEAVLDTFADPSPATGVISDDIRT